MIRVSAKLDHERELGNGGFVTDSYELTGDVNVLTGEARILGGLVYRAGRDGVQEYGVAVSPTDIEYAGKDVLESARDALWEAAEKIGCTQCGVRVADQPGTLCTECQREHAMPASLAKSTAAALAKQLEELKTAHPELHQPLARALASARGLYEFAAAAEFGLTEEEVDALFGSDGCGETRTAKEAAAYIRDFVARHTEGR